MAYDTFLMHGSVLALDGKAYMFTAPSGTGKSTMAANWRKYFGNRICMVNDDKPLMQIRNGQIYACGTPWNGKHGIGTNIMVPLAGICYLKRAEDNEIRQLPIEESFPLLLQQTYRSENPAILIQVLDLLDQLLEKVPVYEMQMNNFRENAVPVAFHGMVKE